MRSVLSRLFVVGALTAGCLSVAPAAHAEVQEVPVVTAAPEDAAGCTLTYVDTVGGPYILPNPPTVSYTPPATVTVDADETVNFAVFLGVRIGFATVDYVFCIV